MYRNNQNNIYGSYSYLPSSSTTSSQVTTSQIYDSPISSQRSFYSHRTPVNTYASSQIQPQYRSVTNLDSIVSLPQIYIPSTRTPRISKYDSRISTAEILRERLLIDIQHNMNEIDKELSSLELRTLPRYIPRRLLALGKKIPSPTEENRTWSRTSSKVYDVIPRISSGTKSILSRSVSKLDDLTASYSYIGQYHYGPETEENVIIENDPENSDLKSTVDEIPNLTSNVTLSTDQISREQSSSVHNRALIFVPEYVDDNHLNLNETTEDLDENDTNLVRLSSVKSSQTSESANKPHNRALNFVPEYADHNQMDLNETTEDLDQDDTNPVRLSSVKSSQTSKSTDKPHHRALNFVPEYADNHQINLNETTEDLNQDNQIDRNTARLLSVKHSNHFDLTTKPTVENLELLIQTAPERKPKTPSPSPVNMHELSDKSQGELINTTRHIPPDTPYFFSDFGNEDESNNDDSISIDPHQFAIPNPSEIIPDDQISRTLSIQAQKPSVNPPSSQKQRQKLIKENSNNNNQHHPVKETENKKSPTKTNSIPKTTLKLPSNSTTDNVQIELPTTQINQTQRKKLPKKLPKRKSPVEELPSVPINNFSIELHSFSSTPKTTTTRQHSLNNFSTDIIQIPTKHTFNNNQGQIPTDLYENSEIPISRYSPETDNRPSPSSRSTTPERRNSIPFFVESSLLESNELIQFVSSSTTDNLQTNTERNTPNSLVDLVESQQLGQSNDLLFQSPVHSRSPSLSIHIHDNEQLKTFTPCPTETKLSEHETLRLPSISPPHSYISDANRTSVDREETIRQPISSNYNQNPLPLKQPTSQQRTMIQPPKERSLSIEEEPPLMTASQRRSKLSLIVRRPPTLEKKRSPRNPTDTPDLPPPTKVKKPEQHRHVLFANEVSHISIEKPHPLQNWRERINSILERRRFPKDRYAHVKARVNSFANFEYQPREITVTPRRKLYKKLPSDQTKERKVNTRIPPPKQKLSPIRGTMSHISGRLWHEQDGSPRVFHESLRWNAPSKLREYSLENLNYKSYPHNVSLTTRKKPRWYSESRISNITKKSPRRYQILTQSISLQTITDLDEYNFYHQDSETERKIFDINSNSQQSMYKSQEMYMSNPVFNSKQPDRLTDDEKLLWAKKSRFRDPLGNNTNHPPKKPTVRHFQMSHQPYQSTSQSKISITHSLTWDIQAKAKYWSETDIYQLTKSKGLFSESDNLNWSDLISSNNNYLYSSLTQNSFINEFDDPFREEESPANRPKWNAVSKTRSVNTLYDSQLLNSNTIRKGWDLELRRKRVHKLPPLKRKRHHEEIPHIPSEVLPLTNGPITSECNYDQSSTGQDHMTSIGYLTSSSRRSSKALVPLRSVPDLPLSIETPRSQRPVQQEWYEEITKSRSTQRTNPPRTRNNSIQDSIGSNQHTNSSRDIFTLRSSTRNSQNSLLSSTLIDSSIRTNRATELRLSRDMDEYHQHSHSPSESMPFAIRGFELSGTPLTVPENATIRPLSNVNYRASERIKTRRIFPWSSLHQYGATTRNSVLLPITEFRHPSFETTVMDTPRIIHDEQQ